MHESNKLYKASGRICSLSNNLVFLCLKVLFLFSFQIWNYIYKFLWSNRIIMNSYNYFGRHYPNDDLDKFNYINILILVHSIDRSIRFTIFFLFTSQLISVCPLVGSNIIYHLLASCFVLKWFKMIPPDRAHSATFKHFIRLSARYFILPKACVCLSLSCSTCRASCPTAVTIARLVRQLWARFLFGYCLETQHTKANILIISSSSS